MGFDIALTDGIVNSRGLFGFYVFSFSQYSSPLIHKGIFSIVEMVMPQQLFHFGTILSCFFV